MKKDLLSKMKMPSQAADPMLELGEDELAMDGEEAEVAEEAVDPVIAQAEDDVLVKELEKRGFSVEAPAEEMAEDESAATEMAEEDPLA